MAGKRFGFEDTRGTIFFDIIRIAKHVRPKYMLLENVKGLVNHDEGRTFKRIIRTIEELRIFETIEWFVFNSKNHGVAQNRERIFIFCSRGGSEGQVLLERESNKQINAQKSRNIIVVGNTSPSGDHGRDVLSIAGITSCLTATDHCHPKQIALKESEIIVVGNTTRSGHNSANVYSKEGISSTIALSHPTQIALEYIEPEQVTNFQGKTISNALRSGGRNTYTNKHNWDTIIIAGTLLTHKDGKGFREMKEGICPTIPARAREDGSGQPVIAIPVLTPDRLEKRQNGRRFKTNNEPSFTITAQDKHGVYNGKTIRRITPLECERLQGFPDDWTRRDCDNNIVADTSRYKALGNAVTVNVIEYIGRNILNANKN